jgi:hypothetical protein
LGLGSGRRHLPSAAGGRKGLNVNPNRPAGLSRTIGEEFRVG